jgi:hypothetical protein
MRHAALLQAAADQRQDRRDVLQPFTRFVVGDDAEIFQIERQIVRQLAAVQLRPAFSYWLIRSTIAWPRSRDSA